MKRTALLSLAFCLMAAQLLCAQTTTQSKTTQTKTSQTNIVPGKTPDVVLNAFKTKYPNTNVTKWEWKADKKVYEADFMMASKKREAWFSPEGKWIKTKTDITKAELPAAVSKAVMASEFAAWEMADFGEIDTPDKGKLYKVEVQKGTQEYDLKYDASGKLVEKKADTDKKSKSKK